MKIIFAKHLTSTNELVWIAEGFTKAQIKKGTLLVVNTQHGKRIVKATSDLEGITPGALSRLNRNTEPQKVIQAYGPQTPTGEALNAEFEREENARIW